MSDIFTKEKRSEIMSKISGKETKPEILVRKYLFVNGFRFRKNDKRYPGNPDIVLPKYKTMIFIHGCFWHAHNCPAGKLPKTNKDFWEEKISRNIERDKRNNLKLGKQDWKIITIWQCELKNKKTIEKTLIGLKDMLHNKKDSKRSAMPVPVFSGNPAMSTSVIEIPLKKSSFFVKLHCENQNHMNPHHTFSTSIFFNAQTHNQNKRAKFSPPQ